MDRILHRLLGDPVDGVFHGRRQGGNLCGDIQIQTQPGAFGCRFGQVTNGKRQTEILQRSARRAFIARRVSSNPSRVIRCARSSIAARPPL